MNLKIVTFIALCLSSFGCEVKAQEEDILGLNPYLQRNRIGLVDEFIDRFNGEKTHPSIPNSGNESRKKNLMMLFDLELFKSKNDPYMEEAANMMDCVISQNIKIGYADTTWMALAHCIGNLEGKTVNFDVQLKVQHRRGNMYKWVITNVEGNIFDVTARNKNELIMFYPDDHETHFMSLGRMTKEQPHNVQRFMGKDVKYDMTSVFTYLVFNKKLTINYVEDLEFVFFQIPGYVFHLKFFNREKTNAGWLISRFYKTDSLQTRLEHTELPPISEVSPHNTTEVQKTKLEDLKEQKDNIDKNLKAIFWYRMNERLGQLKDYVSFFNQYKSLNVKPLYASKIKSLFVPDATVKVKSASREGDTIIKIAQFCDMLCDGSLYLQSIDSICVPIWDDKIYDLGESVTKCELASFRRGLEFTNILDDIINESFNQKLIAFKVITEKGIEWIPQFGDMVVTSKD